MKFECGWLVAGVSYLSGLAEKFNSKIYLQHFATLSSQPTKHAKFFYTTTSPIRIRRYGYPEETWKGSLGQVVQVGKGEGIPRQSCFQVDPIEQEVWFLGEEQGVA